MDAESLRAFLLSLPDVCETMQWGDNLVYLSLIHILPSKS